MFKLPNHIAHKNTVLYAFACMKVHYLTHEYLNEMAWWGGDENSSSIIVSNFLGAELSSKEINGH